MISRKRALEILNRSTGDDRASRICDHFLAALILLNLLAVSLESIDTLGDKYALQFFWFEIFSVTIFGIEYVLRIWAVADNESSRYKTALGRRFDYIFSFTGLIDLAAILPSILPLFMGQVDLRWLRVLRLLRLLKISHYSSALEDLFSAIRAEKSAFGAALYLFCIALFISSSLMYVVENTVQPEHFSSIPTTMWWSLITLTTVGYGDVSPVTWIGKVISIITALMGVSVVALLTGILANAFSNQIARRKMIFEDQIREALQDGVVDAVESRSLEALRKEFGLSSQQADALMRHVQREKRME